MDYKSIIYGKADGILTLTLNRPDELNTFTRPMTLEIMNALDRADADDDVRVIVVTGAGKAFSAGAALADITTRTEQSSEERDGNVCPKKAEEGHDSSSHAVRDFGGVLTLRIFNSLKPVIAAVNGAAVGIGLTMQLAMDIRIASRDARFGLVFARRGIVPDAAASWFLSRIVGISRALQWCYSGRVFGSDEALKGGLIQSVHEPDDLLPAAYAIAREIADNTAPVSIALTRQMLWRMTGAPHPMEAHIIESRALYSRRHSTDAREGISSFLEKRPAHYTNKVSSDMPDFYPWWTEPQFE